MTLEITGMPEENMEPMKELFQNMVKNFEACQKINNPNARATLVFE
jgi:hypothetical protein